jgi:tetratricopeptide (TPR) repeat protein
MLSRATLAFTCLALLAVASANCSRDVERVKREYVERGDRFVKENKVDEAIIEYRNAIQQDPRFAEAYRKLSAAYLAREDGRNALRAAVTAADLLPEVPDAQVEAGNLLLLAGKFDDAKARAQQALAKSPTSIPARVILGNALAGLKDIDTAINEFEEALRLDPQQSGVYASLGALQASRGDRPAAEEAFRQAIANDSKSTSARLALAQFYWSTDRPKDAERTVKEALVAKPGDQRANVALAVFYEYMGQGADAEPYLKAAVAADPTARVTLLLADYYLARNRSADAVPLLKRAASDRRFGGLASIRLAAVAQLQGRPDEATRIIDQALLADPKNSIVLTAKSDILRQQHKLDDALKAADAAAAADPSSAQAEFVRGRVLLAKGRSDQAEQAFNQVLRLNPRAAVAQVEVARLHLNSGASDTVALATQATRADPRSLDARLTLVRALIQRHEYAQAQTALQDILRLAPRAAVAHALMGVTLTMTHDVKRGREAFGRALELDAFQLEAIEGLTALDLNDHLQREAISRLEGLLDRAPKNASLLVIAARAYGSIGDAAHAEALLVRAIEADPGFLTAYSMLGRVYLTQHRLDEARAQFEKIVEAQDRPVGALTMIGMIDQMQNRIADATKAFERALRLDPHAGAAANNLAWIYAETGGSLEIALDLARTAQAALPDQPEVNDTLGWVYYKKDQPQLAVAALRHSVELDPQNATSSYHLALAYERSGDRINARRMLELYLKLDPSSARSTDVKKRLEALGV